MPPSQPYQMPATPQPHKVKLRVSINPFHHFYTGAKNLLSYNGLTTLAVCLIYEIIAVAGMALMLYMLFGISSNAYGISSISELVTFIAILIGIGVALSLVLSVMQIALIRCIVTSMRKSRQSVGQVLSFCMHRIVTSLKTYLLLLAMIMGPGIFLIVLALVGVPSIAVVLLGIIFLLYLIILSIRITFVSFLLADDEKPPTAFSVIRRSSKLFTKAVWAVLLYGLMILIIAVAFNSISNTGSEFDVNKNSTSSTTREIEDFTELRTTTQSSDAGVIGAGLGAIILGGTLVNFIVVIFSAGTGSIYIETRRALGVERPLSPPPQAASPPQPPMQQPPFMPPNTPPTPVPPQSYYQFDSPHDNFQQQPSAPAQAHPQYPPQQQPPYQQ